MITRQEPTYAALDYLYTVIRETVKDPDAYYTEEQVKALKKTKGNIFLEREVTKNE